MTTHHYITTRLISKAIAVAVISLMSSIGLEASDYQPGYIVLSSNDTINGLVDFVKGNSAYRFCHFKKSTDEETVKYKPTEINGYGFLYNKVFVARLIQVKDGTLERVFLNLVNSGLLRLYQSEDAFFLEKDDLVLHKLTNETTESVVNGVLVQKKTNRHVAILNMLMQDMPQLQDRITKLTLDEESLASLVDDYNKFKGVSVTIYKNRNAPRNQEKNVVSLESRDGYNHYESLWSLNKSSSSSPQPISLSPRMADTNHGFSFLGGYISTDAKNPMYTLINPFFPSNRNHFRLTSNPSNGQFNFGRLSTYLHAGFSDDQVPADFRTGEYSMSTTAIESFYRNPFSTGNGNIGYWGGVGVTRPFTSLSTYLELRYQQASGVPMGVPGQWSQPGSNVTNVQLVIGFKRR